MGPQNKNKRQERVTKFDLKLMHIPGPKTRNSLVDALSQWPNLCPDDPITDSGLGLGL
jgi:hypothetical protein